MLLVEFPEQFPEIVLQRMEKRMARHDCTQMRPIARMIYESLAARVVEHIETGFFKRAAQPVLFPQHAVMRLFLKFNSSASPRMAREFRREMVAEKFHGVALVGDDCITPL